MRFHQFRFAETSEAFRQDRHVTLVCVFVGVNSARTRCSAVPEVVRERFLLRDLGCGIASIHFELRVSMSRLRLLRTYLCPLVLSFLALFGSTVPQFICGQAAGSGAGSRSQVKLHITNEELTAALTFPPV